MATNDFKRDNFRRVVSVLLFSIIIIIVLVAAFIYITTHPAQPQYYSTSIQGRINPIVPLDQPNLPPSALLQWANQAAVASFAFDFEHYQAQLQDPVNGAITFFTPAGWSSFISALQAKVLPTVIAKKVQVTSVATGVPVIMEQGVIDGVYTWKIQMPMLINYQSASTLQSQSMMMTIVVQRVSTLSSYRGIGISSLLTQ